MSDSNKQASTGPTVVQPYQADVIHVLRTTQMHHVMLGMIADQKANIILGAFLIFITVSQGMLEAQKEFTAPILVLSIFFTVAAIFALLVITPRFRNPKPTPDSTNLLFFGCFTHMSQQEYIDTLSNALPSNGEAKQLMMKDIYQIGKVLSKKYTNLRYSYMSLGLGIVASALWLILQQLLSL